jgi:coenzyme F420 biosynthesis associated uncharacterized protein
VTVTVVDWGLAERIGCALAGTGPDWGGAGADALAGECDRAVKLVSRYTGLRPRGPIPQPELVGRDAWVRTNLSSFQAISAEVERSILERTSEAGPAGSVSRTLAGAAAGVEVGLATGYLAQRVVGQYDVSLIGPVREPRLLFVAPNLESARARLGVDRNLFMSWIALHEATHAVQFAAVPWLRGHIGGLAQELLASAAIDVEPGEFLGRIVRLNPKELVRAAAAGQLATLLWSEPQRRLMDELLAVMTLVEGYAEHVMDAVGDQLSPGYADLRRSLDRDRERRGLLDRVVSRLLGLELKLSQYRRGKAFADAVAGEAGIRALNRAWRKPDALPTSSELDSPEDWMERVHARRGRLASLLG